MKNGIIVNDGRNCEMYGGNFIHSGRNEVIYMKNGFNIIVMKHANPMFTNIHIPTLKIRNYSFVEEFKKIWNSRQVIRRGRWVIPVIVNPDKSYLFKGLAFLGGGGSSFLG